MPADDIFGTSRTGTPMMQSGQQHYNQYGQPVYPQAYPQQVPTPQAQYAGAYTAPAAHHQDMYEHQQYLQQATQPQTAIDPGLEAQIQQQEMGADMQQQGQGVSHFDDALGEVNGQDFGQYFDENGGPGQTLAPAASWEGEGEILR